MLFKKNRFVGLKATVKIIFGVFIYLELIGLLLTPFIAGF